MKSYQESKTKPTMAFAKVLRCGLINIQSVGNKTMKIRNLVNEEKLDLLMLTETWLKGDIGDSSKIKELTPKTHYFYHSPRKGKIGGGVGLVVSKSFSKINIKNQLTFQTFEHMNVEILNNNNKVINLTILYRPPTINGKKKEKEFIEEFSNYLDTLNFANNTFICGDFNIWLDNISDKYTSEFHELLDQHNLTNSVSEPTTDSGHIIDLVIHHNEQRIIKNIEVEPECAISPFHKMIIFDIDMKKSSALKKKISFRDKTKFDAEAFIDKSVIQIRNSERRCMCIRNIPVDNDGCCVSCYTESSNDILSENYKEACPLKEIQIIVRDKAKWFNNELRVAKRKKRQLEDKWKRTRSTESKTMFNRAKNSYNNLLMKTKIKYYNQIEKDPKRLNKNLDDLLGIKGEKVLPSNYNNDKNLADNFVKYYDEKTDKICSSLTNENFSNVTFVAKQVHKKLVKFRELNLEDLKRVISKIKYTYCESDPFPISDTKKAKNIHLLYNNYMKIVNMSIRQTKFPRSEKLGVIKPTYKGKGDKNDLSSYRPISNLSYLSKIIEKTVDDQLWSHLKDVDIIPENQSAYRENHSTETTMCSIMNDMIQIISEGRCGILVMLDLSAAFDTVVHEFLLNDLKLIGVDEEAYMWFESYLGDREVTVAISHTIDLK